MKESSIRTSRMEGDALASTAISGLLLSSGVMACAVYLVLTLMSLEAVQRAFAQSSPVAPGVRLEAGIEKEDVDGDLKSAMTIYEKIAADTSAPRDVRAKALLRLAGCDEKLGKQAKQVYEQIVHDYADQPAAAQARSRLALLKKQENPAMPTTMNVRKIEWAGLGEMKPCDTDGHRAVYRAGDGNLYFGDLAGQNRRLVFKVQPGDVPSWCVSRDLSMAGLTFFRNANRPTTLAVVKTDGTGYRELVQDDAQGTLLGGASGPCFDWSWDSRHLLVSAGLPNGGSHVMIVDVADGHHRELVSFRGGSSWCAVFSPDGQTIAYSTMSGGGSSIAMHIFVMPTEGGKPQEVYQSPAITAEDRSDPMQGLHGWTADGRDLVFSDVHFRKSGLYLLPMKSGLAAGNPVFVREVETNDALITASGAFVFKDVPDRHWSVFLATLEPDGKLGAWRPLDIRGDNWGRVPIPSFSPDGGQIAYVAGDEEKGGRNLILRNLATGHEQVLYWFNSGQPNCHYAYDLPRIFCSLGWDDNGGHSDLVSIAAESGAVEKLASFSDYRFGPFPTKDDQHMYFWAVKAFQGGHFVRWDNRAGQDTVVDVVDREIQQLYVSTPDERWLIRTDSRGLAIRPMGGGDWRFLVSAADSGLSNPVDAYPEGDWILFEAKDSEGKHRLYRIPISGGEAQLIGDFPAKSKEDFDTRLFWSRDARQVIAEIHDEDKFNLWTLDNFEPLEKK